MNLLAIDPGTTHSQFLIWDCAAANVVRTEHVENTQLLRELSALTTSFRTSEAAIEQVAAMGMIVGQEVFETVHWSGRFHERLESVGVSVHRIKRNPIKLHHCQNVRAKDANIRQAIIDRFGGKEKAIGRRATPGPLYSVSGHGWAALALALTHADTRLVAV